MTRKKTTKGAGGPNDDIIEFLKKKEEEAKRRDMTNLVAAYDKARRSVEKYPKRLEVGEANRLQYIGDSIMKLIDDFILQHAGPSTYTAPAPASIPAPSVSITAPAPAPLSVPVLFPPSLSRASDILAELGPSRGKRTQRDNDTLSIDLDQPPQKRPKHTTQPEINSILPSSNSSSSSSSSKSLSPLKNMYQPQKNGLVDTVLQVFLEKLKTHQRECKQRRCPSLDCSSKTDFSAAQIAFNSTGSCHPIKWGVRRMDLEGKASSASPKKLTEALKKLSKTGLIFLHELTQEELQSAIASLTSTTVTSAFQFRPTKKDATLLFLSHLGFKTARDGDSDLVVNSLVSSNPASIDNLRPTETARSTSSLQGDPKESIFSTYLATSTADHHCGRPWRPLFSQAPVALPFSHLASASSSSIPPSIIVPSESATLPITAALTLPSVLPPPPTTKTTASSTSDKPSKKTRTSSYPSFIPEAPSYPVISALQDNAPTRSKSYSSIPSSPPPQSTSSSNKTSKSVSSSSSTTLPPPTNHTPTLQKRSSAPEPVLIEDLTDQDPPTSPSQVRHSASRPKPTPTSYSYNKTPRSSPFVSSPVVRREAPQSERTSRPLVAERWQLYLLADVREADIIKSLQQTMPQIQIAARPLSVGDFAWMIKVLPNGGPGEVEKEYMLEYIVERKTIDDMIKSIVDRRYREQKFRLERCLIERRLYLIEGKLPRASSWMPLNKYAAAASAAGSSSSSSSSSFATMCHSGTPTRGATAETWTRTVHKALISTEQLQGFSIQFCDTVEESAEYIGGLHRYIERRYEERIREKRGCASAVLEKRPMFGKFQESSSKSDNLTVSDLFAKQLMQVRGASVPRVYAITQLYPTITALLQAYASKSTKEERELLVADLRFGPRMLRIGPALSRTIYATFNDN